jgi:hypothetical protein
MKYVLRIRPVELLICGDELESGPWDPFKQIIPGTMSVFSVVAWMFIFDGWKQNRSKSFAAMTIRIAFWRRSAANKERIFLA